MTIIKQILAFVMLLGILFSISCSKKIEEDGWVNFDLYGTTYKRNQRQFMIRANPMIGEGEKMKTIEKGERVRFEFNLGPTPDRAKQELEVTEKELQQLAQGNIPKGEKISTFDAARIINTDDPIKTLKNKISYDTTGLNLDPFFIRAVVPEYIISNPPKERHNCWIMVDEMTDNRIKGRFGGIFQVDKLSSNDINMVGSEVGITNGMFDVPLKKLYRFR